MNYALISLTIVLVGTALFVLPGLAYAFTLYYLCDCSPRYILGVVLKVFIGVLLVSILPLFWYLFDFLFGVQ